MVLTPQDGSVTVLILLFLLKHYLHADVSLKQTQLNFDAVTHSVKCGG